MHSDCILDRGSTQRPRPVRKRTGRGSVSLYLPVRLEKAADRIGDAATDVLCHADNRRADTVNIVNDRGARSAHKVAERLPDSVVLLLRE